MSAKVEPVMTPAAEHDEIFFAVRPRVASPDDVMDVELVSPPAVLALPAVPLQDFHLKLAVAVIVETQAISFANVHAHADRLT
jgi:hypothetical protein